VAKNLKKFVNPRFLKTIDLSLLQRLFDRHSGQLRGLDLGLLNRDPDQARQALLDFFAGPEQNYPRGLVADLHRIAEVGTRAGMDMLLERARAINVGLVPAQDAAAVEHRIDPKHLALRAFLDHPAVFNAASDLVALMRLTSLAEFAGLDEGVEPRLDEQTRKAFEQAAARLFEADLHGKYCRVGWYEDDDEIRVVVTHGTPITTVPVVEGGEERIISFSTAEQAVLSYSAAAGRLKVGGVSKARCADFAEMLAAIMLERPKFFAAPDAQELYTLKPVEAAGFGFTFDHAFDPAIRRVQIVEAQADRITIDPRSGEERRSWSLTMRDNSNALFRLGSEARRIVFSQDGYRLNHIVFRVQIEPEGERPARLTVKLKPPGSAMFKRERFEGQIMTLLRRNGLCREREHRDLAVAAQ
jgi:hypothetical protein